MSADSKDLAIDYTLFDRFGQPNSVESSGNR